MSLVAPFRAARRRAALALAALLAAAAAVPALHAQARPTPAQDRAAVRQAVLDYVEGFYTGDTTRLVRSIARTVVKNGWYRAHPDSAFRRSVMGWPDGFMGYARRVREGAVQVPANAPKEIAVFDVQDQTASAKLTAWWGTDYLLLARDGDRWVITHVLWQSPPRK